MSGAAREFVFCVDTEEVATAMAPPAPVVAQLKRRVAQPTVALRLPDLSAEPAAEVAPPSAPSFTPWVAPEISFSMPPKPDASMAPAPSVALPMLPPTVAPTTIAAVEEAPIQSATPNAVAAKAATPIDEAPQVAAEQEPLWKNPKFMLAGVAAAFLGMVSLIAMNHHPEKATEDAPPWQGASAAPPQATEASDPTPLVVRGSEKPAPEWSTPASHESPNQPAQQVAPNTSHGATPTTLFADRGAAAEPYRPTAQQGWTEDTSLPPEEDDMETGVRLGAPLPNLQVGGAYEASHTDPGYPNTTR